MNILALDVGSRTGWTARINGMIESGVETFSIERNESRGMRFLRFRSWLDGMITTVNPSLIVYERPHQRGGPPTEFLYGLTTRIDEACSVNGIDYKAVHIGTLKKFATGKGNASKDEMMAVARQRMGREPIDDNESDSYLLLEYAIKNYVE